MDASHSRNKYQKREIPMKNLILGVTAASFMTATSFAGNLSEPLIQEVEEPEAASSSAPWLALLLLAGVAVFIATQDDNTTVSNQE